jgi:hypothetical protein
LKLEGGGNDEKKVFGCPWIVAIDFLAIEETIAQHVLAKICEHC